MGQLRRLVGCVCVLLLQSANPAPAQQVVKIGVIRTLFRDASADTVKAAIEPFRDLMDADTGQTGEISTVPDAFALAKQLDAGEVQLGVMPGFQLAWVRAKYPRLRPLTLAVNQDLRLHAFLVVRKDSPAAGVAALKGKTLALPDGTRDHCRLFLERLPPVAGKPEAFFGKITRPTNTEDALEDVVDGTAAAALVDDVALRRFARRKPDRSAQLKELEQSVAFPATAVVYAVGGGLDDDLLGRFRRAMLNVHKTVKGQRVIELWKLSNFAPVPRDYEQMLTAIAKTYPPPAGK